MGKQFAVVINNNIYIRALKPDDWSSFRAIRLKALKEHPDVYLSSYDKEIEISESGWKEMLDGNGKCIFGLYENNQIIGLAAVFTWRNDSSGRSGVMAMDYVDARYRGRRLSKYLYESRIDWALNYPTFTRLVISHREGNEASRRANQAFGFRPTGMDLIEWPDGSKANEYMYALDLETLREKKSH